MDTENMIESFFSSKDLYNVLFENASEAIIFASDSKIIDCNSATLFLFGYFEKSEMVGCHLFGFSPKKQADGIGSLQKANQISLDSSKLVRKYDWEFQKKSGVTFISEIRVNWIEHANQHYQCVTISELSQKQDAEKELTAIENLLENIIEAIPQPLFAKDDQFIYTHCNQAFAKYLGKPKDQIIGSTVFQISEPEKANIYQNADIELFNSGNSQIYESKVRSIDNRDRDVIFRKNIILDQDGEKVGIVGIIDDVTEFKKNREELVENELKYKKIFENVQDVFYRTDLNGILTEISPSIKRYSKYVHSDIIGQPIEKFYVDPAIREQLIHEIRTKGEALDFEVLLKGLDDQQVWSSVNAHFSYDDAGNVDGVEGTIRDLTERKQAEEKLKFSLSLLKATLDSTADGILVVDQLGKISSYNEKFRTLFDISNAILDSRDDKSAIESVLNKLEAPDQFLAKIKYLYDHPLLESFDTIELKDGRILERYSCPQYLEGIPIGRAWNFRDVTARKKSEQQIRLLAHALKSINESICITDNNKRIVFVNSAFVKTYGYDNENELLGQNVEIFLPSDNKPELIDEILISMMGEGWQGEMLNKRKDGTDFPISLSSSTVQDENGNVLGIVGVSTDITERKLAEKALADKEAQLRTLLQTIPDLIWLKDTNGVYLTCNKTFEQFFGATEAEIVNKTDYDFVDKELADFFRENDRIAMRAGKPTSNEEWIMFASDGHKALLETIKMPMYDAKGEIIGVIGIGRDISYRKQAEDMLKQSEAKYRKMIETMPDGVYRSTPNGKFVDVNMAMVKILGYETKEELLAIDIVNQLYINSADREKLIVTHDFEEVDVYPVKKKDGTLVWLEDHGWYIKDDNGDIVFHEGISRDITQRKKAEVQLQEYSEQLRELNATKDKFFSIIAHDLKSPFNSILGLSEIIKTEGRHLDIATIEQYAGIIHSTSNNTFKLLENLLDWARMQQSQMPFHRVSFVLKTIADEVIELMIENANSKIIAIINYIPDNLIILADKNMIKTILRNLVSNALKFTSVNGKVEIKAAIASSMVSISVEDTGTGIKQEEIDKMFKVGSSFSKRGTENEKGTGIGLLLCKEFVEKHGGRIWVESEVGKGSKFIFSINLDELITQQYGG